MRSSRTLLTGLFLALGSLLAAPRAEVLVLKAAPGGAAEIAGLRPGDRLISWERISGPHPGEGSLDSVFRVRAIEIEQAPLGPVTLAGLRSDGPFRVTLSPRTWRLETRPAFDEPMLAALEAAEARAAGGEAGPAAIELRALASRAREAGEPRTAAWLLMRSAAHLAAAGRWKEAELHSREALALAGGDPDLAAGLHSARGDLYSDHALYAEAAAAYQDALEALAAGPSGNLRAAELLHRRAIALHRQEELEQAEALHTRALEIRRRLAPGSLPVARSLDGLGASVLFGRRDLDQAEAHFLRAREILETIAPGGVEQAVSDHGLGVVAWYRGDMAGSEERLLSALEIRRRLEPGTLDLASTLGSLAGVAWRRSDLGAAEGYMREVLEIRDRISPGSLDVAKALNNLGLVLWNRGDLPAASDHFLRSLELKEKFAPGSLTAAMTLNNLGIIALHRGDLASAEAFQDRAIRIREEKAPDSLDLAMSHSNLGILHWQRGDFERAQESISRSLAIRDREAPGGIEVAKDLSSLGTLNLKRGDLAEAAAYHRRALEIRKEKAPDSLDYSESLLNLGHLALERSDLAEADRQYRAAMEIRQRVAPGSLSLAHVHTAMARLAEAKGGIEEAISLHSKALEIRERLAPGSTVVAESAVALGRLHQRNGDPDGAVAMLGRAVSALESQQAHLGGVQEVRTEFRARRAGVYRELAGLLVDRGKTGQAFDLLERFRTRGLLAQLAERDLVFSRDVAPELEKERRHLAADYDSRLEALAGLSSVADAETVRGIHEELVALRLRQAENREAIRRSSPRLAALRHPEPLNVAGAQAALDQGTVLLSYSVGEDRTLLFVLRKGRPLDVWPVAAGESALGERIRSFREGIRVARDGAATKDVRKQGRELHRLLVEPAKSAVESAERLLIVPDGPLDLLPFEALVLPGGEEGAPGRWLVERKPVHQVSSTTVYAELKSARPARPAATTVVAFGDPAYNPPSRGGGTGEEAAGSIAAMRQSLKPLPASREEVNAIVDLFGGGSRALLGGEATESRARSLGKGPGIIHFAAHGLVDSEVPLDSAIALSIPETIEYGKDNGLLQAWEIFESLRIDADLVTLSGCETALGRELAGEGMIGLTRAFQYAGARTVLASLWAVSDRSTARLMKSFYSHLKAGMPKDEALRAAQMEMIRSSGTVGGDEGGSRGVKRLASSREAESWSAPFYWAAFQVIGDWK